MLTNIRVVWFANLANNFNVSLPYMQIKSIRVRESKFGETLVLETFTKSGGYVLGFKVDPHEKLVGLLQELEKFHSLFSKNPIFGVSFAVEAEAPSIQVLYRNANISFLIVFIYTFYVCVCMYQALLRPRVEEDVRWIDDPAVSSADAIAAVASHYYASQSGDQHHDAESGHSGHDGDMTHNGSRSTAGANITYDARLGLAIEALPPGGRFDLDMLWRVV